MIFAANSALTNRSSASGRFRSANTFPELGADSRLRIVNLLSSWPACGRVGAAAGSDPILVAESRFRTLPSSEKHEARKQLSQTVRRTPHDTCRLDRLRAPARPFLQSRAYLRAFMLLPNLRLVQRETSFCRTDAGKLVSRSSESTSQTN